MRTWILMAVLCLLAGMAAGQSAVEQQLLQADRDFNKATQEKRLDGWMQYWDENGVMDRLQPVVGADAVRRELAAQWADPSFQLSWEPVEVHAFPGGKKGYTRGNWALTQNGPDGKPVRLSGEYLTIWQQNKAGEWKIIWDGGAANLPTGR
jgi:ketosteroid isomerase-like protein